MMSRSVLGILCVALGLPLLGGCWGGPGVDMVPVRGTVKFTDGTVPQGEVATITFDPVAGGSSPVRKVASGQIKPDGGFELSTVKPGDGAIVGKYKVTIEVYKNYIAGRGDLQIPEKYTKTETTPFEVTVESGMKPCEFVLDKPGA